MLFKNAPVPVISHHEALPEKGIQGYCSLTEDTRRLMIKNSILILLSPIILSRRSILVLGTSIRCFPNESTTWEQSTRQLA
jgi:hypothetical protein